MSLLKTYQRGEPIPQRWMSLHWRQGRDEPRFLVLTFLLPWRARLYGINTDDIQLRRPRVSIYSRPQRYRKDDHRYIISDSWWHEFTREEFMKQGAGHTQQVVTAANLEELQKLVQWTVRVGDVVYVPNPIKVDLSPFGQLRSWLGG